MSAILELIKTLIPFGMAFLFLWAIGRMCCTNSQKPKTPPDRDSDKSDKKSKKSKHSDQNKSSQDDTQKFKKEQTGKQEFHSAGIGIIGKHKKLSPLQQAFLLKEILDPPKALKPFRKKYPR